MSSTQKTKIFVGHLPDGCRTEDLQALFEKYGAVKECDVINKYGFVHMTNADDAAVAIKNLNNHEFMGSRLSVEPSKSKLHLEPGTSGRAKPRSSDRNGYGPSRNYSNGYKSSPYSRSSRDPYYDRPFGLGSDRLRPYPSPYDRRSPSSMMTEDYMRRLPPQGTNDPYGRSGDLYARSSDIYARISDPYARISDPYARVSDPYARPSDPYARPSDPYARPLDPYARPSDPYARPLDPYARPSDPYARSTDPYARALPSLVGRDELYERRSMLERSDYLYSRRSSPPVSSLSSSSRMLTSTSAARRLPAFY